MSLCSIQIDYVYDRDACNASRLEVVVEKRPTYTSSFLMFVQQQDCIFSVFIGLALQHCIEPQQSQPVQNTLNHRTVC